MKVNISSSHPFNDIIYTYSLEKDNNLSMSFCIQKNGSEYVLPIAEEIRNKIFSYFNIYTFDATDKHNCKGFCYFIYQKEDSLEAPVKKIWNRKPFNKKTILPGEIIAFYQKKYDSYSHWALYLGEGIYLSKYGNTGIKVDSLERLKKFYEADTIFQMRSKTKKSCWFLSFLAKT